MRMGCPSDQTEDADPYKAMVEAERSVAVSHHTGTTSIKKNDAYSLSQQVNCHASGAAKKIDRGEDDMVVKSDVIFKIQGKKMTEKMKQRAETAERQESASTQQRNGHNSKSKNNFKFCKNQNA